jgi:hypothetical protein
VSQDRAAELAGLAAVGLGVCCGLPLLLGAGAVGAAVGIALGSTLVAAAGAVLGVIGIARWRRRRASRADAPTPTREAQEGC